MYFKEVNFNNTPEFLASQHYINFTKTALDTDIVADENGKKYVLAGSLLGKSGKVVKVTRGGSSGSYTYSLSEDPIGIVFSTVDVTYGPQPVASMVEGYVITERLQGEYVKEAIDTIKAKLPNIKFM
ncbi:hypothetical protein REL12_018155 [Clostridioides difficile]|nr:hypothetical protein [Clostridioides difficile]MBY1263572.1 hypothetical protein [Clostridioides difficile]MDS6443990.1 hypothetical protein [Clostridioides difficile]HBG2490572.1 hypothetical protein [Clostridioides difficile]